ncbi:MAG: PKD domain-containing protein, partial [Candidatus Thermoplasmatota archaeon]
DNDIKKYDWDFDGDGNYDWSGAYGNKTWVYNSTGYYIASLRVVDEDGELDIANTTVKIINNPPVISYCPPRFGKIGDEIIFEAKDAYDPDGHEINYTWEFGDGKFGSEKIVGHRYNRKGNFTVKLIITDAYGAKGGCNFVIAIEEKNAVGKKEENYFIYIGIIFLLAGVPSLLYYRYRKKAKIVKEEIKKEEKKPEISKDELVKKMYLADALKAEKAIEMIKSVVPSKPRIRIKEIECPKCGNFVDRNWEKCIYCQAKLVEKIELKIPVGKEKCRFCGGIVEKGIIKCFNCFKTLTYPDKLSSELRNFLKEFDRIETMIDEFRREKKDIGALKKIAKKAIKYLDDDISLAMEYAKKANRIADELKSRYEIEKVKKGEKVQCSFCRNFVDSYKENCPYCSSALFPEMKEVPKIGFVCRFCKSEIESKWYVCKFCFNPLKDGKDKRFDEAVRLLIKVRTTKNPEGRLLLCKFVEEMNKRNYKEAIKCGLKIKRIEKEEVEKEKMKEEGLGEEEILGKSLEKITEKINELKVKGIKTKDAEVQVELANAFFRTKKFEKAKKYLEEAKDIIEEHL